MRKHIGRTERNLRQIAIETHSDMRKTSEQRDITHSMQRTPNDHLRQLLLELAEKNGLTDSDIARAHIRANPESTLTASTVQRFRTGTPAPGTPPSSLMEEAYAEATGTSRQQNWNEAIRRWRLALKDE